MYHAVALWVPTLGGTVGFVRLRKTVSAGGGELTAIAGAHSRQPGAAATGKLAA
jgi:hypothetical protein